jgi:hypothetical protein
MRGERVDGAAGFLQVHGNIDRAAVRRDGETPVPGDGLRRDTSPVGWVAEPDMEKRVWVMHGRRIARMDSATNWWIGDWMRYGTARYGEKYEVAATITGYESKTLMNMAFVSSRFAVQRRRAHISWSHHAELAGLPLDDQDDWLARLEHEPMSVRSLRQELKLKANRVPRAVDMGQEAPPAEPHESVCPYCGRLLPRESAEPKRRTERSARDPSGAATGDAYAVARRQP